MPLSPSMNVIALLHDAVFMKAGSYVIRPNSASDVFTWRRSIARTTVSPSTPPCRMGVLYAFLVRESVMSSFPISFKSWLGAEPDVLLSLAMLRSPGGPHFHSRQQI